MPCRCWTTTPTPLARLIEIEDWTTILGLLGDEICSFAGEHT